MFALLSRKGYRLHEVKAESWQPIIAGTGSEGAVAAFVDGGNASKSQ